VGASFPKKVMLKQKDTAGWRFEEKSSRSEVRRTKYPPPIRTLKADSIGSHALRGEVDRHFCAASFRSSRRSGS